MFKLYDECNVSFVTQSTETLIIPKRGIETTWTLADSFDTYLVRKVHLCAALKQFLHYSSVTLGRCLYQSCHSILQQYIKSRYIDYIRILAVSMSSCQLVVRNDTNIYSTQCYCIIRVKKVVPVDHLDSDCPSSVRSGFHRLHPYHHSLPHRQTLCSH